MGKEKAKTLCAIVEDFGNLLGGQKLLFWAKRNGRWVTALLDALELLELRALDYPKEGEHGGNPAR